MLGDRNIKKWGRGFYNNFLNASFMVWVSFKADSINVKADGNMRKNILVLRKNIYL